MPARTVSPLQLTRSAGLPFARLSALAADLRPTEQVVQHSRQSWSDRTIEVQAAFDALLAALPLSPLRTAVYRARRDFFQRRRLPDTRFWDGMPAAAALSEALEHYRASEQALRAAEAAWEQQYAEAVHGGYAMLQAIAREPEFQRALLFASHSLLEQLPRFAETPVRDFTKKERQIALAVLQYATRMATKTAPLSRFARVSISVSAASEPDEAPDFGKAVTTPNVALLEALYALLLRHPVFYRSLPLTLNPCIAAAGAAAYAWVYFDGEQESFQHLEANPALDFLCETLLNNRRQMPFEALLTALAAATEAGRDQAEAWLLELADVGFLEWVLPEPGLSADWCSGLYRYLGFLPAEPLIVDTAALLQWLRSTARVLPYQSVPEAIAAQRATAEQVRGYFERWSAPTPPIPPEQLFYEDVEVPDVAQVVPKSVLDQLADAWRERSDLPLPAARAAFAGFVRETVRPGQPVAFLELARAFLEQQRSGNLARNALGHGDERQASRSTRVGLPPEQVGALVQVFEQQGKPMAVVNALYPGGGKLFARWLHLFSPNVLRAWRAWANSRPGTAALAAFPWQGYFNANLQPALTDNALAVPGGRMRPPAGRQHFLLGNLEVAVEDDRAVLRDRASGRSLVLTDLGLEAAETRPPVMRLLGQIGVPYVSREALLPESCTWQPLREGVAVRPRCCRGTLVLARATWSVEAAVWETWVPLPPTSSASDYRRLRDVLTGLEVPRHFWAHSGAEEPQAFDRDSPLSMLLFQKILRQGAGPWYLTEMLPVPTDRATEAVVEITV